MNSRTFDLRLMTAVLASMAALGMSTTEAADWSASPKVTVTAVYDDNHRMASEPSRPVEVSGGGIGAQVLLAAETPKSFFRLTPGATAYMYPGDDDEDTDSQFVRLATEYRTLRTATGLDASYFREDVLWGYLPAAEVSDQLGNPTAGERITSSEVRNTSERFDVTPSLNFQATERVGLGFNLGYLDQEYSQQVEGESQSYTFSSAAASLGYALSQRSTISLRADAGRFEPKDGVDTTTYGLTGEWAWKSSDITQFYLRAGADRVEVLDANDRKDWENGFSGGVGVRWQWQVTSIVFDVMRYADPSSAGGIVNRDQVQFRLSRRFTPLLTGFFGARAIQDQAAGGTSTTRDLDYATANVGFDWRFARKWSLVGSYQFVAREYEDDSSAAESNSVRLGIVYEPKRL